MYIFCAALSPRLATQQPHSGHFFVRIPPRKRISTPCEFRSRHRLPQIRQTILMRSIFRSRSLLLPPIVSHCAVRAYVLSHPPRQWSHSLRNSRFFLDRVVSTRPSVRRPHLRANIRTNTLLRSVPSFHSPRRSEHRSCLTLLAALDARSWGRPRCFGGCHSCQIRLCKKFERLI
ncbi:hypothetical protein BC826DRAFT_429086 [Russula brevipes]|nr:hypothetical protein BC826DRAFT_429086 [Russula brevipes]